MKVVIFSPLVQQSAIARSTALVASAAISAGHEVVIVRCEAAGLLAQAHHATRAGVVQWTDGPGVAAVLRDAECIAYQIGDNFLFHEGCLHWLARQPGVVCLHDPFVAHLFNGWALERREEATRCLEAWCAPGIAPRFFGAPDSESFIALAAEQAPMTEWVCAQATAVIVHSHSGIERVLRSCAGPVEVVPLAYDAPGAQPALAQSALAQDGAVLNLLTVGNVNANKRALQVIRAIGTSGLLREQVRYRVCGAVDSAVAASLAAAARESGVQLTLAGAVDDAELKAAFDQADVISALRWPSIEGASATAIEGMLYGKAVMVTDTGFYSELPGDLVRKVRAENEIDSIREALEGLLADPALRRNMAARGQAWASATFTADNYAQRLIDVSKRARSVAPVLHMVGRLAMTLKDWGGAPRWLDSPELRDALAIFGAPVVTTADRTHRSTEASP